MQIRQKIFNELNIFRKFLDGFEKNTYLCAHYNIIKVKN